VASGSSGTPGNRGAPPRGVDVKPLRRGPPRGLGGPGQGPGPARDGLRDPGVPGTQDPRIRDPPPRGLGEARNPVPGSRRVPDPSGRPGEGGFTSTPRAGAPRYPRRGPGVRGSPGGLRDLPGGPKYHPRPWRAPDPLSGNRGAPARGVDVKPPPGDPGNPDFYPFLRKMAKNGHFGRFSS